MSQAHCKFACDCIDNEFFFCKNSIKLSCCADCWSVLIPWKSISYNFVKWVIWPMYVHNILWKCAIREFRSIRLCFSLSLLLFLLFCENNYNIPFFYTFCVVFVTSKSFKLKSKPTSAHWLFHTLTKATNEKKNTQQERKKTMYSKHAQEYVYSYTHTLR